MRLFLAIIPHLQWFGRNIDERIAAAGRRGLASGDAGVELRAGRIAARRETRQMGDNRKKSRISLVEGPAPGRCPFGEKNQVLARQKKKKASEVPTHDPALS